MKKRGGPRDPSDPLSRRASTPLPTAIAKTVWKLRYSSDILTGDLGAIGHASLELAKTACAKKLSSAPEQYGEFLHDPLHGLYKLKVSHLRIVYHVEPIANEVWVLMIADRKEIWTEEQLEILARLEREHARHKRENKDRKRKDARR